MGRAAPLALLLFSAAPAPGPSTFRNVADDARPALVHLVCGNGHMASGVIVGGKGEVLGPSSLCEAETVVAVRVDGSSMNARRIKVNKELGLMLLQLPEGSYPAAPIGDPRKVVQGSWLVAVSLGEKGPEYGAGMASGRDPRDPRKLYTDAPAAPGSAVFALDGSLVGVAVGRRSHRARVVPVDVLKSWLSGARP